MELLFYLGVLLPTLVVVVAFIVFLLCWFRLAARLPFCKKRRRSQTVEQQQQQQQHSMPPLPPVPQQTLPGGQHRGSHQTVSLDQLHQPVYALDDDGRLLWDKYTVRDSMHSLYFGDRPQPAIPASVTFPALAGFPALQHHSQLLHQQQQRQQSQQQPQQSSKFAKSASCLFQTGRSAVRRPPGGMVSSNSATSAFGFRTAGQPPPPPHPPPPPPLPQQHTALPSTSISQLPPASTMIAAIPGGRRQLKKSSSMEQAGGHRGNNGVEDAEDAAGQYQLTYSAFARTRTAAVRDPSDHRLFNAALGKGGAAAVGGIGGGGTSRDNSAGTSDPRTPSESASESERSHLVRPLPLRTMQHQLQHQFQQPLPPSRAANAPNILNDVHSSPDSSPVIGESST